MQSPDVTLWAAFSAGVLSFLSPCVLPLVPGYLSFMSGLSLEELESRSTKAVRRAGIGSIFFVLGFTAVFTSLGASASAVGRLLDAHYELLAKIAGVIIAVFGLHLIVQFPIEALYRDKRAHFADFGPHPAGCFLMGLAFAFGWTPCIGPILGGILALAATQETVLQGVRLLLLYSLGLGLPFIVTGFALNAAFGLLKRYKPFIRWGERGAGALLIVVGVLIFLNKMTYLIRYIPDSFMRFAK